MPGGAADKAGLYHEALWGVRAFLMVLNGEASAIRIETPGDDGAEFHLIRGGVRQHWQAKRQVTKQDTWSFRVLKSEGVLAYFFEKFRLGERCAFASVSEAPELRLLTENAAAAPTLIEFKQHFSDRERAAQFVELGKHLGGITEQETYDFLRSVEVHGGREITLEPLLGWVLGAMYQGAWQTTMDVLRSLYLSSTHETLTAADIENHLQSRGIKRRRASSPEARDKILATTRAYVAGQRAKLIRGTPIRRAVADDLVAKFQSNSAPLDVLISSKAGAGRCHPVYQASSAARRPGLGGLGARTSLTQRRYSDPRHQHRARTRCRHHPQSHPARRGLSGSLLCHAGPTRGGPKSRRAVRGGLDLVRRRPA